MGRHRRRLVIIVGLAAVAAVSVALVLLYVPIAQQSSGYTAIGLRLYSFEAVSLFGPNAEWQNYSYRGVTFGFHLWCNTNPGVGTLCGNATDSSGASYPYSFGDDHESFPAWQTWVSPDGHEAVQYRQGGLAHLLVTT